MLTDTQQDLIDVMHLKAQGCIASHRTWRDSNYKDRAATSQATRLEEGVKAALKAIINEWLEANSLTAFIRSEICVRGMYPEYTHYQIQLGATSIFNGKGGLDKKSRWLNKITVTAYRNEVRLRAHKARTDPDFLEPTAAKFTLLMQHIQAALNSKSPG